MGALLICVTGCKTNTQAQTGVFDDKSGAEPHARRGITTKSSLEQRLLAQAEKSFRRGRYTTPQHDNAYDTFHSVLLLNADNSQARAGLQAILLRYAQLIRGALQSGRLSAASAYLNQVELFYPANALLMDLRENIRSAKLMQPEDISTPQKIDSEHEEFRLSVAELEAKSSVIKQTLAAIVLRLKESGESVLIFARNDREGRWIYQQMKQLAEGYRVRGDIRISSAPKVRILPPL